MIMNERQCRITEKKVRRFVNALEAIEAKGGKRTDVHPQLVVAEREAIEAQLAALRKEVEDYRRVKDAGISAQVVESRL